MRGNNTDAIGGEPVLTRAEALNAIKERVTAVQAADALGLKPNSAGFAVCPFHNDHDSSLKLYDGKNGFFCFGCGKGGDVVRLVQLVNRCSFTDALRWLNSAFSLGLDISTTDTPKALESAKNAAKREAERRDAAKTADKALFDAYCMAQLLVIELEAEKERYQPKFDEEWDPRFTTALRLLAEARELTEDLAVKVIGVSK